MQIHADRRSFHGVQRFSAANRDCKLCSPQPQLLRYPVDFPLTAFAAEPVDKNLGVRFFESGLQPGTEAVK